MLRMQKTFAVIMGIVSFCLGNLAVCLVPVFIGLQFFTLTAYLYE